MDACLEGKVNDLLQKWLHLKDYDCGTILECIRSQARVAGHDVSREFAFAGLAAGPEARVASRLVGRAIMQQGDETPDYEIRKTLDMWLYKNPRKGRH